MKYCITCGKDVLDEHVLKNNDQYTHTIPYDDVSWLTYDCCDGILVSSAPPPITDMDWEAIFANEPSPDEFKLMEQEAEILLESLIMD